MEKNTPMSCPPVRVLVLATHPIQYQAPLWRLLSTQPGFELLACFGTDMSVRGYKDREFGVSLAWDTPLLEGYNSVFLSKDPRIQQVNFSSPTASGIRDHIIKFKPDVAVMTAYFSRFHLELWWTLRRMGIPIVMRHEASDVAHARKGWKAQLRDFMLRRFYARIDQFAYIGVEARRHLTRLGVSDSRLIVSPYCVDSAFVGEQVKIWAERRASLRLELGIGANELALVFSGKLIPKKNPLLIARALAALNEAGHSDIVNRIHVIVAGDGELRAEVEAQFTHLLGNRAHILGFLNQREMGRAYACGDCLVLPSGKGTGETWGLVVNEAMQYGLPCMVSDGVGCHSDLIVEGETGWVFASNDGAGLALALRQWAETSDSNRLRIRANVEAKVRSVSIEAAAEGLTMAIRRAANNAHLKK